MVRVAATAVLVVATVALIGYPGQRKGATTEQKLPGVPASAVSGTVQPTAQPVALAASVDSAPAPVQAPKPGVEKSRPALVWPPVTTTSHADVVPTASSSSADAGAPTPAAEPHALETARLASTAESTASSQAASEPAVTITGCLEEATDETGFRLSDTEGANAPKARGWRSGFLKKRPAPVELIEPPDTATLRKYLGHRVTATGVLNNRQLRVRTVAPAGASCD